MGHYGLGLDKLKRIIDETERSSVRVLNLLLLFRSVSKRFV